MRDASLPLFTYEEMEEPQVVKFGYTDFIVNNDKRSTKCIICRQTLVEKKGITSAFTK